MEISSKNCSEQRSFEIQEIHIKDFPKTTNSSMGKDREEDDAKCVPYDLFLSSTSIDSIQGKVFDGKTGVILLEPEAVRNRYETDHAVANCRVIELSHSDSKMALRQQFGQMSEYSNSNLQSKPADYENMNILRKLPPDTVVIRQEKRRNKENSDYKELTETNSSGSNSTSSCAGAKAKRISRVVRNKTREAIEVRRNPMRVSKKNINKDFSRPKQRLLANKKREICYESGKCTRSSATPYMNTRSVTRKMYTVGATYQAPTKRDEAEWKEWPVHGMHERPVYHPQAGLAVEYLGRYFTSLDRLSYCKIIDEPEIEVVAVDPHRDRRFLSIEKKPKGKTKLKSKRPLNDKDAWSTYLSMKNKSFETCMHGSLHCVLGYCSQIMTPTCRQAVEEKTTRLTTSAASTSSSVKESAKEMTNFKDNATCSSESVSKFTGEAKLLEAYAIAMAQSAQNKSIVNNSSKPSSTFTSSSATYVPEVQRLIVENDAKSICSTYESDKCMSRKMIQMDLKRILRGSPNNSLILLRSSAERAKGSGENYTVAAKDVVNSVKLEDASIGDETLMEMSSIYKKLMFADADPTLSREEPRHNLYSLKRHVTNSREYSTKVFMNNQLENKKIVQVIKENNENRSVDEMKSREFDVPTTSSGKTRAWCTTETSEIAKILSEYNRGASKKSAIQNPICCSRANLMNSSIKSLPQNLWNQTDPPTTEGNRSFVTNVGAALDFSQGKWKFHATPEKTKDTQVTSTQVGTAWNDSSLENRQVFLKDLKQMNLSAADYAREKPIESRKDTTEQREIIMVDAKSKECSKGEIKSSKTESLQELLENTALLYCAANGVHQDNLSNYIDTLDNTQSIQWLENWNNSIV